MHGYATDGSVNAQEKPFIGRAPPGPTDGAHSALHRLPSLIWAGDPCRGRDAKGREGQEKRIGMR